MKNLFWAFLLLTGSLLHAQSKEIAYLPECAKEENPKNCTAEIIGNNIIKMVSPKMRDSIRATGRQYFSFSIIFIVDATGKVMPKETRFLSEITQLKEPVLKYIAALPAFTPKAASEKERRDVYFLNKTFVLNDTGTDYRGISDEELNARMITPNYLPIDKYPVYPGCEGINDTDHLCISSKLRDLYIEKFKIPRSAKAGTVRMRVSFVVNEEGEVYISEITGGDEDFQKEVRRVFKKIPPIKPAYINDIAVKTAFALPIKVNVD